ncbi:dnaJ homolog subfamily C member 4-like [Corticium candelabrum]|uniref:dnaJ homolog subfamily C member 4-like n=1 Tax=Corticium candelabrum TaxID=121492 RepID=UPI002E25C2BF|nr:dnaJ homolog subfamily C member 4-like [Corticium candelabrum]
MEACYRLCAKAFRLVPNPNVCFKCLRLCSSSRSGKPRADGKSFYDILDVESSATRQEIREAFIIKSKQCHPDKDLTNRQLHQEFVLINEAYNVLNDPIQRRNYDIQLRHLSFNPLSHYSSQTSANTVYHRSEQWRDIQFTREEYYRDRRSRNLKMAGLLVLIVITGAIVQYKRLQSAYETIGQRLDDRSRQLSLQYHKVREQARSTTTRQQLDNLILRHQQDKLHNEDCNETNKDTRNP